MAEMLPIAIGINAEVFLNARAAQGEGARSTAFRSDSSSQRRGPPLKPTAHAKGRRVKLAAGVSELHSEENRSQCILHFPRKF